MHGSESRIGGANVFVGSVCGRAENTKYFIRKIYHSWAYGTECVDLVFEWHWNKLHYHAINRHRRQRQQIIELHPPYFHEALVSAAATVHALTRLVPETLDCWI